MALRWLRRLDQVVFGSMIHALGGYTFEEVKGVEDFYVTERDKDRQERETLEARLGQIETQLLDIRDRRLIASSVPEADWNETSRKHTLDDVVVRLDKLTEDAERRRKRSSDVARARPRDAAGRFLK